MTNRASDNGRANAQRDALAFRQRTEQSERGHLVMLMLGALSAAFAWTIGWPGWAMYLTIGNVLVNVYPVLLQRYTRSRLVRLAAGSQSPGSEQGQTRVRRGSDQRRSPEVSAVLSGRRRC